MKNRALTVGKPIWSSAPVRLPVCVCLLSVSRLEHDVCVGVLPSMMEICTALRRVLGTLVKRGPWVIDGQLRLGTMPALDKHK